MNELMNFNNEMFGEIRVGLIDDEIWFVGRDVVRDLEYDLNTHSYTQYINKYISKEDIKKLNNPDARLFGIEDAGRKGELLINEYALYDLVFESLLPSAKLFKKWVTHEVLPQIRKTSGYIPVNKEDDDATIMAKALLIAQKTIDNKDEIIKNLTPKADWFDKLLNSNGTFTSTQVAKLYGLSSAQKLNKLLNDNKIIYKQGGSWLPYSNINMEWFKIILGSNDNHNYSQLKFTPKGVNDISKKLNIEISEDEIKKVIA